MKCKRCGEDIFTPGTPCRKKSAETKRKLSESAKLQRGGYFGRHHGTYATAELFYPTEEFGLVDLFVWRAGEGKRLR